MDGQKKHQWGVTNPINEAQPTEGDLKLNDRLVETLKRFNNFESPEGTENRKKVLVHLQNVAEEFIRRACRAKALSESVVNSSGGKIFTFGSYALGAYGPTSDIDTLICAPKHVYIEDFFRFFPPTFREMSRPEDITEFNPVPEAFVPIIKMEYCGVSIDLIFVSLPSQSTIPKDLDLLELPRSLLNNVGETGMRSLNGTRQTKELLNSVPQHKSFRHALRAVKLWAEKRAIYGNVYGYPGGIAWAIMVARICQLYPFACGATILTKFFNLMLKWHWPRPVFLKHIEEGTVNLRVWNPSIYKQDQGHLMPIITPAFPSMCSTHTVMHSTLKTMMDEFERANGIITQIQNGRKDWADLFERHTFFTKDHKYYLSVIAGSRTKEAQDQFSGLVGSKVRILAKGIEEGDAGVDLARPYIKSFSRVHRCETEDQIDLILKGSMDFLVTDAANAKSNSNAVALEEGDVPEAPGKKDHVPDGALIDSAAFKNKDAPKEGAGENTDDASKAEESKNDETQKEGAISMNGHDAQQDGPETKNGEVSKDVAIAAPKDDLFTIYTTTFYIGLNLAEGAAKSLDISYPVQNFKRMVIDSESYNEDTMAVHIIHTRNYDLPDDVFEPGETKATKPVKEKKKKMAAKNAKRSFAETGLDDSERSSTKRREAENKHGLPTPSPA